MFKKVLKKAFGMNMMTVWYVVCNQYNVVRLLGMLRNNAPYSYGTRVIVTVIIVITMMI